jgi:ornithine decarboxylase
VFVVIQIALVLNKALNKYFPPRRNVRIIAEPGRYYVASAFSLTVSIISKRKVTRTVEEGVYAVLS